MRISDWSSDVCSSDLHGLSYTRFSISQPHLSADRIAPDGQVIVTVDVANIRDLAGDEVVQLSVGRTQASVTQPLLALKGFRPLALRPGERRDRKSTRLNSSH